MLKGSSPRVWGQAQRKTFSTLHRGIIPTRMGTRIVELFDREIERDHPHAYGDKRDSAPLSFTYSGSSPRVWGQVDTRNTAIVFTRIIPTRMGTRSGVSLATLADKDHPHAYGDKCDTDTRGTSLYGSSPRVWGQGTVYLYQKSLAGIIPTRMGTRYSKQKYYTARKDHPHAYGDKLNFQAMCNYH